MSLLPIQDNSNDPWTVIIDLWWLKETTCSQNRKAKRKLIVLGFVLNTYKLQFCFWFYVVVYFRLVVYVEESWSTSYKKCTEIGQLSHIFCLWQNVNESMSKSVRDRIWSVGTQHGSDSEYVVFPSKWLKRKKNVFIGGSLLVTDAMLHNRASIDVIYQNTTWKYM